MEVSNGCRNSRDEKWQTRTGCGCFLPTLYGTRCGKTHWFPRVRLLCCRCWFHSLCEGGRQKTRRVLPEKRIERVQDLIPNLANPFLQLSPHHSKGGTVWDFFISLPSTCFDSKRLLHILTRNSIIISVKLSNVASVEIVLGFISCFYIFAVFRNIRARVCSCASTSRYILSLWYYHSFDSDNSWLCSLGHCCSALCGCESCSSIHKWFSFSIAHVPHANMCSFCELLSVEKYFLVLGTLFGISEGIAVLYHLFSIEISIHPNVSKKAVVYIPSFLFCVSFNFDCFSREKVGCIFARFFTITLSISRASDIFLGCVDAKNTDCIYRATHINLDSIPVNHSYNCGRDFLIGTESQDRKRNTEKEEQGKEFFHIGECKRVKHGKNIKKKTIFPVDAKKPGNTYQINFGMFLL